MTMQEVVNKVPGTQTAHKAIGATLVSGVGAYVFNFHETLFYFCTNTGLPENVCLELTGMTNAILVGLLTGAVTYYLPNKEKA